MSDLDVDDLIEAWIRAREFREGPIRDYYDLRFGLMCIELHLVDFT